MKTFAKPLRLAATATILSAMAIPAYATPNNSPTTGYITGLGGGWTQPTLLLVIDVPFYNPENCPVTDGYMIPDNISGNQLLTSLAMTAYSLHKKVSFTVDGCYESRPRVIGLVIMPGQ